MVERPDIAGYVGSLGTGSGLTRIIRSGRDLSFVDVLKVQLERETGITFSAHAMERLNDRGITFGNSEISRLSQAVEKAQEKGAVDSLILLNDTALIVSIKNKTVVTALSGDSIKDNVFTNIDSAVIA
ncbi:flagellar biosynthesis protein [bacterium]|nr:flagellar biosynthesis protein [bacterium]